MQKQWHKYYQPGLISLTLLPVVCCIYFGYNIETKGQHAIVFNTPRSPGETPGYKFPPDRHYKEMTWTGQKNEDRELQWMSNEIKEKHHQKDTTNGICIHLGNNTKYQTLITIIDICNVDSASIFGLEENDFYIAPFAKKKEVYLAPMRCGNR